MSAPSENTIPVSNPKTGDEKKNADEAVGAGASTESKPPAILEEDDEFEDFPVEDWPAEEATADPSSATGASGTTHLWEESWDDDEDANEEFSKQLKEEMKKVEQSRA